MEVDVCFYRRLYRDQQFYRGHKSKVGQSIDPLFVFSDLYTIGPHISTCGHVMHIDCWQKLFKTVLAKERRRPFRYGRHVSFDVDKNHFLCPLCECLSNCVIPIIPALYIETKSKRKRWSISISDWLLAMHSAVEKVQSICIKDPAINGKNDNNCVDILYDDILLFFFYKIKRNTYVVICHNH